MASSSEPCQLYAAESFSVEFIEHLVWLVYEKGKVPTKDEMQFLQCLKSHDSAISLAGQLLVPGKEQVIHEFGANLLNQTMESLDPGNITEDLSQYLVNVVRDYTAVYGDDPSRRKILRKLMTGLGIVFRSVPNWKVLFEELALSFQTDFFHTMDPSPAALDTFFILSKFGFRRTTEAYELVIRYFIDLLSRHFAVFDPKQAMYLKFLADWIQEDGFGTPSAEIGRLMTIVSKYVDCPERQHMPWGIVQMQASLTLEEFIGLQDVHLLQNSLLEVLGTLVAFPTRYRVEQMDSPEKRNAYLETIAKIYLNFNLEFADIIVACCERPETQSVVLGFMRHLRLLADPFPDQAICSPMACLFSSDAIAAFSELSSLMYQMSVAGSKFPETLLPEMEGLFSLLIKKACKPPKSILSAWSEEEKEKYREIRQDLQKAMEALTLAVNGPVYKWFLQEFQTNLLHAKTPEVLSKLAALCWMFGVTTPCSSSKVDENILRSLFESIYNVFSIPDQDVISQAFRALESWISVVRDDQAYAGVLRSFIPVCVAALQQENVQIINSCATTVAALVEAAQALEFSVYLELGPSVTATILRKVGRFEARGQLLVALARSICNLSPETSTQEINNLGQVFGALFADLKKPKDFISIITILSGFFRTVASETVEIEAKRNVVIHEAIMQLGSRLLDRLYSGDMMLTTAVTEEFNDAYVDLMKNIIHASGSAAKGILPNIVPFVQNLFLRNPSPGILALISELLTSYLDMPGSEDLFGQLCVTVFQSVLSLSKNEETWTDFTDLYRSFVLTAYPIIRHNTLALLRLGINWDDLLTFAIKLVFLPPVGDSHSVIQADVLFEELLRMRPREPHVTDGFINPVKTLLQQKYGQEVVRLFLQIFYAASSHVQTVKTCAFCLSVMLTEMRSETARWLNDAPKPVSPADHDSAQRLVFDKLLLMIARNRSKFFLANAVSTYRKNFRGADDIHYA